MELSQEKNRSAADKSLTSALCIYTYCILYYIMIGFFCRCPEGIGFCIQFWTQSYQYTTPLSIYLGIYIILGFPCICVYVCVCVIVCAHVRACKSVFILFNNEKENQYTSWRNIYNNINAFVNEMFDNKCCS